jgi:hypothetical protein
MTGTELTIFRKAGGILSKRIALSAKGEVQADGSECRMAQGTARRIKLDGPASLAQLIDRMRSDEALSLGRLRDDLPEEVEVVTKRELNGSTAANTIARSLDYIEFAPGAAAYMLLDHDAKGMPQEVAANLKAAGGFWSAIIDTVREGETLADPLEGVSYGIGKVKVMIDADSAPWIHSFAHGRTTYQLRYDATALRAILDQAKDADLLDTLIRLDARARLSPVDDEELIHHIKDRSGRGFRVIARALREARKERRARAARAQEERELAARSDPRPRLESPCDDAPWLPEVLTINEVIAELPLADQPYQDIDGDVFRVRRVRIPGTHLFNTANPEPTE